MFISILTSLNKGEGKTSDSPAWIPFAAGVAVAVAAEEGSLEPLEEFLDYVVDCLFG